MQGTEKKNIDQLFADRAGLTRALTRAVQQALLQHKRAGNPIAIWRDGKVVWIDPQEIQVQEED
jgi:hypothetical protein